MNRKDILGDEILIIENGGEMPEVTYHGSLYFLTKDPDGPLLKLSSDDLISLKKAVVEGYRKIIIRDIILENRDKGHYRGLKRCAANWERLSLFCKREELDLGQVSHEVCKGLREFFNTEVLDVITLGKATCVNCTAETLNTFFRKVGLDLDDLPPDWEKLTW